MKNMINIANFPEEQLIALSNFGSLLGLELITIKVDTLDLESAEREAANAHRIAPAFKKFYTESIRISKVDPVLDKDGNLQVRLNDEDSLRYPLTGEAQNFRKISYEHVVAMLESGKTEWFTDGIGAIEIANQMNKEETQKVETIMARLNGYLTAYQGLEKVNNGIKDRFVSRKKITAESNS